MPDAACGECTLGTLLIARKLKDDGRRRVDIAPSLAPEKKDVFRRF